MFIKCENADIYDYAREILHKKGYKWAFYNTNLDEYDDVYRNANIRKRDVPVTLVFFGNIVDWTFCEKYDSVGINQIIHEWTWMR